jgi:predicted Rossmann-fold nucleotide-binding protein
MRRVCIFCGSNNGARTVYVDAADAMGAALARRRIGLVYGGGRVGLLGVVADAVMAGAVT